MNYQLVIQFREKELNYDNMIALENILISELGVLGDVDGHDFGSGEVNFFIITNKPEKCFLKAKQIITSNGDYGFKAAYRKLSGEQYTILWPEDLTEFNII